MKLKFEKEEYVYLKVSKVVNPADHFMVSFDNNEITVVTKKENIEKLNVLERNKDSWGMIRIVMDNPLNTESLIPRVTGALTNNKIDVLVISTFSSDCIFIEYKLLEDAKFILENL